MKCTQIILSVAVSTSMLVLVVTQQPKPNHQAEAAKLVESLKFPKLEEPRILTADVSPYFSVKTTEPRLHQDINGELGLIVRLHIHLKGKQSDWPSDGFSVVKWLRVKGWRQTNLWAYYPLSRLQFLGVLPLTSSDNKGQFVSGIWIPSTGYREYTKPRKDKSTPRDFNVDILWMPVTNNENSEIPAQAISK